MSDDFDKLRPTGDDDSDDESLDWQQDKPKKPGQSSSDKDLGFTGELSWRKDVEDAFGEQLDAADDDSFDWQRDQSSSGKSSASSSSSGFTGELDWKKVQSGGSGVPDADDDDSLDWMQSADEGGAPPTDDDDPFAALSASEPEKPAEEDDPLAWMDQSRDDDVQEQAAQPEASFFDDEDDELFATADQSDAPIAADDPLSWLNQYSAGDAESAQQTPINEAAAPSWLDEDADDDDLEAAAADDADLPPWLSSAAPEEKPITEGGKLSEDWLAGAEDAPETAAADMSYDDWQRIQEDLTRPRDIEEEMPDLFSEFNDAQPVSADDLPPASDTGQLPSWVFGMDELDESQAPDWLSENEPQSSPPRPPQDIFAELGLSDAPSPQAPVSDDIFGELGLASPETGYDFLDNPEEEPDPLAGLNLGGDSGTPDWFSETDQPDAVKDSPDWLQDLGDLSEMAGATTVDMNAGIPSAEDDFLAELRGVASQPAAEIDPMDTSGLQDIDSLLASYDSIDTSLPSTDDLIQNPDMDRLLSDNDMQQISARRGSEGRPTAGGISGLSPDAPDWLTELGANVDEVSAAAIVRKQTQRERPLDELSDRLQALHEAGLDMPTSEESKPSEVLRTLLPGVTEVLPAAPLQVTQGALAGDLVLSDAQRNRINLLKTLVGTDEGQGRTGGSLSAIDLTLATPNFSDMTDDEPDFGLEREAAPLPEAVPTTRKRRRTIKIDRILIGLLLAVAVILPYVVNSLRIGDLPPAQFAAGSREQTVFDRVDTLRPGDLALVAAEYGPTGAGELDSSLDALLRHILMRGARPVIVSGNPVGLLHARNVLDSITEDAAFLQLIDQPRLQANQDYYVLRYLAASTVGLRAFGEGIAATLEFDNNGQATNLSADSLKDFALVAVVAESAEEIRGWAEQIAPLAGKPLVAATGQSAAPLSEPYVLSGSPQLLTGLSGLLVGYRDAYTYRSMLDARLTGADLAPIPTIETPTPLIEETPEATSDVDGAALSAESTDEAGTDTDASPTPEGARPTNTVPPTATNTPTNTPTQTPTATLTPSITPTFEPGVTVRGVIDSDQSVNVREGPGRTFPPVASAAPGTIVEVTGRNGDGEWLKIKLEDGSEGWVSSSLVAVEAPEAAVPEATQSSFNIDLDSQMVGLVSDIMYAPALQDDATPEVTAEAESTGEATAEATQDATPEPRATSTPVVPATLNVTPYRDERWYGMTLGLVAIILVITIGMIANILRGLFRRGK
jgi:hypothetical protein